MGRAGIKRASLPGENKGKSFTFDVQLPLDEVRKDT
jgi:hypothetical protein